MTLAAALRASPSSAQPTYRQAYADASSQLRIIASNGRQIKVARDSDQTAVEQVAVSRDHRRVGWLALYPNCCTSYPIPMKVFVLTDGKAREFSGNGLPIWKWSFSANGSLIAIRQSPVHGRAPVHFERRDVRTGRVVDAIDSDSLNRRKIPSWVRSVGPPP